MNESPRNESLPGVFRANASARIVAWLYCLALAAVCLLAGSLQGCAGLSSGEDTAVRLPEDYMPRGAPIDSPAALVTREFGHQSERFHKGMDFSAPKGCPVKATAPGTVVFAGRYKAYGRLVVVRHGTQYDTWYGHLKRIRTRDGAYVRRGETIGTLGESGNATGPHVHYEVHYRGELVDPKGFL